MLNFKNLNKEVWIETVSVRKQNANFGIDYLSNKGFGVRLNGRFIGARYEKDWLGAKVRPTLKALREKTQPDFLAKGLVEHPRFMVWDISATYPVTKRMDIGFNINNILDENYTEKDAYNMPGRNFSIRAIYRF